MNTKNRRNKQRKLRGLIKNTKKQLPKNKEKLKY